MKDQDWRRVYTSSSWCAPCQKMGHPNKKAARRARSQTPTGSSLNTYRCPVSSHLWHNGHLPRDVIRGVRSRDQIFHRRRDT